jgi:hypothetical protein
VFKWFMAMATLVVVVLLTRMARRALNRALNNQPQ